MFETSEGDGKSQIKQEYSVDDDIARGIFGESLENCAV